jgi:21S rRNA (GM2251-2'-O)-methyltransferase
VALKASAGAAESIPLFAVDSPVDFLEGSKEAGWRVYAAVATHSSSHHRGHTDLHAVEEDDPLASDPCILVVGSEGEGLPRMLKAKADVEVSIPNQSGSITVDSLNVSVATALLASAFMRGPNKSTIPRKGPTKSDELGIW